MAPKTTLSWVLDGQAGIDSLQMVELSSTPEIGDFDVLVRLRAVSLNYRDIVLAKVFSHVIIHSLRHH